MSKMQELIDRAEEGLKNGQTTPGDRQAIEALIEAVKLLSKAQAQTMGDISKIHSYGAEPRIGGGA